MSPAFSRLARSALGSEIGGGAREFIKGVAAFGSGFVLAKLITFGAQILIGRQIGPQEFGVAKLVIAGAGLLTIPLQLGFAPAVIKFSALEPTRQGQSRVISAAVWANVLWAVLGVGVLFAIRRELAGILGLSASLYWAGLGYAFLLALYVLLTGALQGTRSFAARGVIELFYAALFLVFFFGFSRFCWRGYQTYIGALYAAIAVASLTAAIILKPWIGRTMDGAAVRSIASYTPPALANNCAAAMVSAILPLILAADFSPKELGIYSAYGLGSLTVASAVTIMLITVLAPMTSSGAGQSAGWDNFFRIASRLMVGSVALFFATDYATLKLVGKAYPFRLDWMALFAVSAALSLVYSLAQTMHSMRDVAGFWVGVVATALVGVATLGLGFFLIPRWGVPGAAVSLAVAYALGLGWCAYLGAPYRRNLEKLSRGA